MPNVSLFNPSAAPTDWAAQQEDILRRRKMAEMLQQQSNEPPQRFSTNGIEAPISWTQGLAKILQSGLGAYQQQKLTEEQKKLGQDFTTSGNEALVRGLKAYQGTPDQTIPPAGGGMEPVGPPQTIPGTKGDPYAAMGILGGHPMTQGASQALLAQLLKGEEPYSLRQGEKRFQGRNVVAENAPKAEPFTLTPGATRFDQTGKPIANLAPKAEPFTLTPGATRFDQNGQPIANLPEKQDFNKAFLPDGTPNPAYQQYEKELKAIGAPKTTVSVDNRAENAYASGVSGKAVDRDSKQYDAATSAVENIAKLDGVINHLKTSDAITGMGSDILKNVERVKVLLANDKAAGKVVSDTEYLDALLGSDVFPFIQQLGIGARGMDTPAEREYIRSVMTGTTAMNKQTLIKMTEIRRDISQRAIDKWNTRVKNGEMDDFFKFSKIPKSTIGGIPQRRATDSGGVRSFTNEAEAAAAGLAPGTKVIINGVSGTWQ